MEILKILFVSEDMEYGKALCDCVRKMKVGVSISIYNETLKVNEYDLIVKDSIEKLGFKTTLPVVDMKDNENIGDDSVYKYKRLSSLIPNIINRYCDITGRIWGGTYKNNTDCKIYAVASSVGGVGCSSISIGIAKDLALAGGERVLYISSKSNADELQFFDLNENYTIREYIYNICCNDVENKSYIEEFLNTNQYGVASFYMDAIRNEINFISIMDFEKVIMNIVESAKFDKIIIDSGNNVTEITKYIMNIADNIVFIKSKIDTLYEKLFLKEVVTVDNFDKLITVSNFNYNVNVKFNDFFEDEDEKEIIKVYEEKEAFLYQGGIVDIEIDGLFGKGIREIVSKINNGKY